jgi:hypothetical protein
MITAAQTFARTLRVDQRAAWLAYAAAAEERDHELIATLKEIRTLIAAQNEHMGPLARSEVAWAIEPIELRAASLGGVIDALNAIAVRLEALEKAEERRALQGGAS